MLHLSLHQTVKSLELFTARLVLFQQTSLSGKTIKSRDFSVSSCHANPAFSPLRHLSSVWGVHPFSTD